MLFFSYFAMFLEIVQGDAPRLSACSAVLSDMRLHCSQHLSQHKPPLEEDPHSGISSTPDLSGSSERHHRHTNRGSSPPSPGGAVTLNAEQGNKSSMCTVESHRITSWEISISRLFYKGKHSNRTRCLLDGNTAERHTTSGITHSGL